MAPELESDDIVLVEGEPSMRLITSPPADSSCSARVSEIPSVDEISQDTKPSSPLSPAPPHGFIGCSMPFRPRRDMVSYLPPVPAGFVEDPTCYPGPSCGRQIGMSNNCSHMPKHMCDLPVPTSFPTAEIQYGNYMPQFNKRRSAAHMLQSSRTVSYPFSAAM